MSKVKLGSEKKVVILKFLPIPIKHWKDPKKSVINTIMFKTLQEVMNSVSSSLLTLDHANAIWAVGWILKKSDSNFSHANWNGWMESILNGECRGVSHIEYQSIIYGDPNDKSTIYTTRLYCIEQQKPKLFITKFDQMSQKLPMIPRLY